MQRTKKMVSEKSFWTPARLTFTVLVLSLFAAFGVSSCNSNDERVSNHNAATGTTNVPAPAAPSTVVTLPSNVTNAELKAVTGSPIKLADYNGKVLVVNLWATWCGPCRLEIPELVKLNKEFRSRGLEIVGLSTEDPEVTAESVPAFVHNFNVDYRIGWATPDVARTLMQGKDAIPQSFVIARNGRVVRRFIGFSPSVTPPQIKAAIEEALNEKSSAD
jgi:thiol-disulfide isomerase/thioredoxin